MPPASGQRARRLRRWALHGLGSGVAAAALALSLRGTETFQRQEMGLFDARVRAFDGRVPADTNVVIVAVDDRSLEALEPQLGRWPWPRDVYQNALAYLSFAGARQVVFDIAFPGRDLKEPVKDTVFAEGIAAAGNVLLPVAFAHADSAEQALVEAETGGTGWISRFALPGGAGARRERGYERALVPHPLFGEQAAGLGSITFHADPIDNVARRVTLVEWHRGEMYPALGLAAARMADPERFGGPVRPGRDTLVSGAARIPLVDGRFLLRWRGPFLTEEGRETYRVYPFYQLANSYLQQSVGDPPQLPPERFRGKTVLVAATAAGLLDLRETPYGGREPGVMLHATLLDNLLRGDYLRPAPGWANVALVLLTALLAGSVVALLGSALWETAAGLLVVLASLAASYLAFAGGLWLDAFAPAVAGVLAAVAAGTANYLTEGRDKRRVREMFSRYVSPEYVRQLADDHASLKLGGERVPVTLLFSDIRGFTTLSEQLPAETVVEVLNEYLDRMAAIVMRHGGTLDKFIGDAVMAFWGAPLPAPDGPRRAADAALDMVAELERLNAKWRALGRDVQLDIGIGINSGEAVVGNIGSLSHKLDYTAIGDAVNLASRLEGLNKQYGTRVIVSDSTREGLGDGYETRVLDDVRVKGKEVSVRIHELTGRRRAPAPGAKAAAVATALAAALLLAHPAAAQRQQPQKARWTDQVYVPGRWQAGRLVEHRTTNPATDSLALVAQVETYSLPPRWRAEIRPVENGRLGQPLVLLGDRNRVQVLTGVSGTPLASHRAGQDPLALAVAARFDEQGRPRQPGPGRLIDRAPDRTVARVTVRRPSANLAFENSLLSTSRVGRFTNSLVRGAATTVGSNRSSAVTATAGAQGALQVETPEGTITVNPDTAAVKRMEAAAVDAVTLDEFIRAAGLAGNAALPIKEDSTAAPPPPASPAPTAPTPTQPAAAPVALALPARPEVAR
jgi:adenylate cyclase